MLKHLCGTPKEHCAGSNMMVNAFLGKAAGQKVHATPPEAFKCHARYLIQVLGYEQIGGRDFRAPDGSGVLTLTKQSRFGAPMRPGKKGDKTSKAGRVQPDHKGSGVFI